MAFLVTPSTGKDPLTRNKAQTEFKASVAAFEWGDLINSGAQQWPGRIEIPALDNTFPYLLIWLVCHEHER